MTWRVALRNWPESFNRCLRNAIFDRMRPSFSAFRQPPASPNQAPRTITLSQWEARIFQLLRRAAAASKTTPPIQLRVAGGWVRDKLMKRPSGDIDIAVEHATGVQFAQQLDTYVKSYTTNLPPVFIGPHEYMPSTCTVKSIDAKPENSRHLETAAVVIDSHSLDVVQLRTEAYTLSDNSRVPHSVAAATPAQDASRRDFTINALFFNLHTRCVEDCTGRGVQDLTDGVLRTPLQPGITVREDPLRALRAFRFVCKLGFRLCDSLAHALRNPDVHSLLVRKVSRERIGAELSQIIRSCRVLSGLRLIGQYGFIQAVFGNSFSDDNAQALEEYHKGLERLQRTLVLCEDEQLHCLSKSERETFQQVGRVVLAYATVIGHSKRIQPMLQKALRRPKALQRDVRAVMYLAERLERVLKGWMPHQGDPVEMDDGMWIDVAEILRESGEHLWVAVIMFHAMSTQKVGLLPQFCRLGLNSQMCNVDCCVNGYRLQRELGLRAGPQVGEALRKLLRLQLQHKRNMWRSRDGQDEPRIVSNLGSDEYIQLLKEMS